MSIETGLMVLTFVTLSSLTAYTNDDAADDDYHKQKCCNGCDDYYHWIRVPVLPPVVLTCMFKIFQIDLIKMFAKNGSNNDDDNDNDNETKRKNRKRTMNRHQRNIRTTWKIA